MKLLHDNIRQSVPKIFPKPYVGEEVQHKYIFYS
jgi:hypothetical protein